MDYHANDFEIKRLNMHLTCQSSSPKGDWKRTPPSIIEGYPFESMMNIWQQPYINAVIKQMFHISHY